MGGYEEVGKDAIAPGYLIRAFGGLNLQNHHKVLIISFFNLYSVLKSFQNEFDNCPTRVTELDIVEKSSLCPFHFQLLFGRFTQWNVEFSIGD